MKQNWVLIIALLLAISIVFPPTLAYDFEVGIKGYSCFQGNLNAPVELVFWGDFQDPSSGEFVREILPQIREKYIKTEKVLLYFRYLPTNNLISEQAVKSAICVGEGSTRTFWKYFDHLFENQDKLTNQYLKDLAKTLMDESHYEYFISCLEEKSEQFFSARITVEKNEANKVGIIHAPGFLINDEKLIGVQTFSTFEEIIEEKLSEEGVVESGESHTIIIKDRQFNPSSLEIKIGDTVEWSNIDSMPHKIIFENGLFESELLWPSEKLKYVFDREKVSRMEKEIKYFSKQDIQGVIIIKDKKTAEGLEPSEEEKVIEMLKIKYGYCRPGTAAENEFLENLKTAAEDETLRDSYVMDFSQLIENCKEKTEAGCALPCTWDMEKMSEESGIETEGKLFSEESEPTTTKESKATTGEQKSPPLITTFFSKNKNYFLIGLVVLIILVTGGYGLKVIKQRPKKEKKEEKEEVELEEKPEISKDIKEAISVSNFTLKYKQKTILENVSFDINRGEMVCLLGPSGTGKSTIIEALVGRKKPTKGKLKILDKDISKDKKIFDYIGFVPQHPELYMNQTVEQNLLSSATKWGIKKPKEKVEKILSRIGLSHRKDLKASKLSGGQQKLLSLGMELLRDIEVCILDEPTTGLDPNTRNNIITILSHISTQLHKTIFFTTHFMEDAEECDNVIILSGKEIVAQGPPAKLERNLPGGGRIVNIILDNVTEDLLEKIEKIEGVQKIIREGRNLKIITDEPNAIQMGHKIDEVGGTVNETKIDKATMMEVFVYHTGKKPE